MRTAVDSSVLLDVFSASAEHGSSSKAALETAIAEGSLVACDVVWAEVGAHYENRARFHRAMETLGVEFDPCDVLCADLAAQAWRLYRRRGGTRDRLVADFLVAAHARSRSDRFLTRDRGFSRRYFPGLRILEPRSS